MKDRMMILASVLLLAGCGRSPAAPRTPVQFVRVPADQVVEACDDDLDEVDEDYVVATKPVEYVPIDEWQPPPSVRKIESKIRARGSTPPDYLSMPKLTLHRPIPSTRYYGRRSYWYR